MKYLHVLILASSVFAGSILSSCSSVIDKSEDPEISSIEMPDNNSADNDPMSEYYTSQSKVSDVLNDPYFEGFGRLLFPVDLTVSPSMTLAQVSTSNVYIWYPYIRVEKTVEILNYLHSQAEKGEKIFYNIYTPEEMSADPSKADAGIFVFKGNAGKPFAITNAGGGFMYVGAMHDSFPHSLEISRAGYTAFALIYRPDDPYNDLARAITFINRNAEVLGVQKENYSLWGGSAGARMAATLGNKGNMDMLGLSDIPQAAAVIMQYTGYSAVSKYDAPTYNCVGSNDGIASWRTMQNRLERLAAMGIPTEFHVYEGLGHGFGLGTGTVAEGWINDALRFWEKNMRGNANSGIPPIHAD